MARRAGVPRPPSPPKARIAAPRVAKPKAPPREPKPGPGKQLAAARIRVDRLPTTTRGPRYLQGVLLQAQPRAYPPMPPEFKLRNYSEPEWAVHWALTQFGLVDGESFFYQSNFAGGRRAGAGGLVVDFWLPDFQLAINVQGEYFHYRTTGAQARDALQRMQLAEGNTTLVLIDETDALERPLEVTAAALRGEDWSKLRFGR